MWDENEVRGDSASTNWQSILPQFFRSKQKNQENKAKRLRSLAHNAKNVERNRLAHNKREDLIDFKSMLQVLDHDPDTRIPKEANVSTISREVF